MHGPPRMVIAAAVLGFAALWAGPPVRTPALAQPAEAQGLDPRGPDAQGLDEPPIATQPAEAPPTEAAPPAEPAAGERQGPAAPWPYADQSEPAQTDPALIGARPQEARPQGARTDAAQTEAERTEAAQTDAAQAGAGEAPAPRLSDAPSHLVTQMANWVLASGDNEHQAFVIVDKVAADVFVFDANGDLLGVAPVLVGLALGDDSADGVGDVPLSAVTPDERTTPAGRFVARFGAAAGNRTVLWVDYGAAISLHPVVTNNPKERRLQRLQSPDPGDHRITFGCINVPAAFYQQVVLQAFAGGSGIVYVLPDTKTVSEVFPAFAAAAGAGLGNRAIPGEDAQQATSDQPALPAPDPSQASAQDAAANLQGPDQAAASAPISAAGADESRSAEQAPAPDPAQAGDRGADDSRTRRSAD